MTPVNFTDLYWC